MNEASLTDLAATVAVRLCGKHEHVCVALILTASLEIGPAKRLSTSA